MSKNCPSGARIEEAQSFLNAHPEIEAIDVVLHDSNGIGRGKIIRRHELISLYENGRHMPISILGLDVCGEDVHETGLIWDLGDGDMRAWPIPGSLKVLHNTNPARAEVLMSLYQLDGQRMNSDPRHALVRQVEELKARGLRAAGAFELEFFLIDNQRTESGKIQPARDVLDGRHSHRTEVYSVDHLHGQLPLFADIYEGAKKAGIKVETLISEYAPGQYELTLDYREDILEAADDLIRLKRIVRQQARAHGVTACFMAKPFEEFAGSGMHFHVSLVDENQQNIFAEKDGEEWAKPLLHAIGGLRETMAESMLVFAPHLNSWRRFTNQSYAPISTAWGVNNRSVALRVPESPKKARRIEHRPSGVDANPYLVAATILAGIMHGLDNACDPGAASGNAYSATSEDEGIPRDWFRAIEMAKASAFLRSALGDEMHQTFTAVKAAEHARVARTISEIDYDLYLQRI